MEVKCTDSVYVMKIFIRSSVCRQRCEKNDVNSHYPNINIIYKYTTSLSDDPLPKVVALVMASGFI